MTPARMPILPFIVVIGTIIVLFALPAWGINNADLLGQHPQHGAHDPFRDAKSVNDFPCCHGRDCTTYEGPVEKVDGGWMIGPWFVAESKDIRPETLDKSVRGQVVICFQGGREAAIRLGSKAYVYCGRVPESGV